MFSLSLISADFNVYCYDRRDGGMSPMSTNGWRNAFDEHRPVSSGGLSDTRLAERGRRGVEMDILADPARIRQLDLTALDS
jgi:hypothetical protein